MTFGIVPFPGPGYDGNDQYTKILLHMEGANNGTVFTDSNAGGSAHTWTPLNAVTGNSQAKFGSTSFQGNANTAKIGTPHSSDFVLGASDWTVDFWVNRNGNAGTAGLFGQATSTLTDSSAAANFNSSNFPVLYTNGGIKITSSVAIADTVWHHLAFTRNGGTLAIYTDGVQTGTYTGLTGSISTMTGSIFYVGHLGEALNGYLGFIDEFRLSVGIARWTANFTPPTRAYY